MNVFEGTGRLTRDPEVRYVGAKRFPIVSLNLAIDDAESRWDAEIKKSVVESGFYKAELKGSYGVAIMDQLSKGDQVYVRGSLRQFRSQKGGQGETQSSISISVTFAVPLKGEGQEQVIRPPADAMADPVDLQDPPPGWDEPF